MRWRSKRSYNVMLWGTGCRVLCKPFDLKDSAIDEGPRSIDPKVNKAKDLGFWRNDDPGLPSLLVAICSAEAQPCLYHFPERMVMVELFGAFNLIIARRGISQEDMLL